MMDNYFYFEKGSYGIRKDQNLSDQYPVSLVAFGIKIQLRTEVNSLLPIPSLLRSGTRLVILDEKSSFTMRSPCGHRR